MADRTITRGNRDDWRRFFAEENVVIGVDPATVHVFHNPLSGEVVSKYVSDLLLSLSTLGATIRPVFPDKSEYILSDKDTVGVDFLFSFHTVGSNPKACHVKHTYRRGFFQFDPLGYAGYSSLAEDRNLLAPAWNIDPGLAKASACAMRVEALTQNTSKYIQPDIALEDREPGYTFLALQCIGDMTLRLARGDVIRFYRSVINASLKCGRFVVVKRHPFDFSPEIDDFISEVERLPGVSVSAHSINQLIPNSERVVVINSSVGIESLIHGKPVFTYGPSEFGPLTNEIWSEDDIETVLSGPAHYDEIKVAQFLHWFFETQCVKAGDYLKMEAKVEEMIAPIVRSRGWVFTS